jgi:hypothetical protein
MWSSAAISLFERPWDDFSQSKGARAAPNWKVLSVGSSGQTFTSKPAQAFADGIGFAFSTTPRTTDETIEGARRLPRSTVIRTVLLDDRTPGRSR